MSVIDSSQPLIIIEQDVLRENECTDLITLIEETGPTAATIITNEGTAVNTAVRNNDRIIFDDLKLASQLYDRLKDIVPQTFNNMSFVGMNERFRCYRYRRGQYFAPHGDGAFYRNSDEQSFYTCLVYLNDSFEGGYTTFHLDPVESYRPPIGTALMFQHPILHEGTAVTSGTKYILRTDLMYRA